jgi:mono/diheme cytochrome c family protein
MFVYSKNCKSCHGDNGDGKGDRAPELSVMPSDFTNAAEISRVSDGELFWKITHGHRPMPAFEDRLNDTERWQVVDYIRTFANPPTTPPAR